MARRGTHDEGVGFTENSWQTDGYAQATKSIYRHPLEPQVISVGVWTRL